MAEFTLEQERAISVSGGTVLVGAAAGSGKTTVMTERIVRELADEASGVDASRILVLTFSRAAAREMRLKIKDRLNRELAASGGSAHVKRQIRRLARAQIGTVHSFCASLLKEYATGEDGIAPDAVIAEDYFMLDLRDRAMAAAAEACYSDPGLRDRIEETSELFGRARSDQGVFEAAAAVYEYKRNMARPERLDMALAEAAASASPSGSPWGRYFFSECRKRTGEMKELVREMDRLLAADPVAAADGKVSGAVDWDREAAGRLEELAEAGDWDGLRELLKEKQPPILKKKGDPAVLPLLKNSHKGIGAILGELSDMFAGPLSDALEAEKASAGVMETVDRICEAYAGQLEKLKADRKMIEYDDLEIGAVKLLYDGEEYSGVAERVSESFDRIYVDEFQDTNERQKMIFDAVDHGRGRLFYVGDVKQSIYRFRNADCRIFTGVREACVKGTEGFPRYLALHYNFRSNENVIAAVNGVFAPLMSRELGGVDYSGGGDPDEGEDLRKGKIEGEPLPPREPGLEFWLQPCDRKELAVRAARYVRGLLDSGYKVLDGGEERPCRPGDFAVLLRAGNLLPAYEEALAAEGIPYTSAGASPFFDTYEIRVILALLHVLDNPLRDVDLAAVMMSPLYGFTADDIARLRLRDGKGYLWNVLNADGDPKSAEFVSGIRRLRDEAAVRNVEETVERVITETRAELLLTAPPDTAFRKAKLRAFIEYAARSSALDARSLGDFLRVCDRAAETGKGPEVTAEGSGGVSVSTIHKSKGLEWPVVILADAGSPFTLGGDSRANVLPDERMGAGTKLRKNTEKGAYYVKGPAFEAIRMKERAEDLSEEMRILYVALTRAKQKIAVFGSAASETSLANLFKAGAESIGADGRPIPARLRGCRSYVSWLAAAFCAAGYTESSAGDAGEGVTRWPFRLVTGAPEEKAAGAWEDARDAGRPGEAEKLAAVLDRRLAYRYPYLELSSVPAKISVTDLTEKRMADRVSRPAFSRGGELSAAEKGTALHRFMQICDYARAAADPGAEIRRLQEEQLLDPASAGAVDEEAVRTFMGSEIGRRALSADRLLREYAFIDSIPACELPGVSPERKEAVLVQGIADCVIVKDGSALLLDYKTDRVKDGRELLERYSGQLRFYKRSIEKRLGIPVTECVIWSFRLGEAVEVE